MQKVEIFFKDTSELAEFEAKHKGYRTDVYVKIENDFYNVRVYDIFTLQQDFEREESSYGYYSIEPNLILVRDANRSDIIETIKKLCDQKYFDELKPTANVEIDHLTAVYRESEL